MNTDREPDEYYTIERPLGATYDADDFPGWIVYKHGTYGGGSVLAGRPKRTALGFYEDDQLEQAKADFPDADVLTDGSTYVETVIPETPPEWFAPDAAGENWTDD